MADVPDDKPAIIYAPTGEQLTRKQLKHNCQRLAYGLRNRLGLKPGDVRHRKTLICGNRH